MPGAAPRGLQQFCGDTDGTEAGRRCSYHTCTGLTGRPLPRYPGSQRPAAPSKQGFAARSKTTVAVFTDHLDILLEFLYTRCLHLLEDSMDLRCSDAPVCRHVTLHTPGTKIPRSFGQAGVQSPDPHAETEIVHASERRGSCSVDGQSCVGEQKRWDLVGQAPLA